MDMRVYVGRAFGSFLFVVAAGIVPAFAQAAQRADVGLSYQFVRFLGDFEENFPRGLNVDVAVPVGADMLSIVGEVGWSRDTDEFQGQDINLDLLNVGGGVRFSFTGTPALAPYGQVIVGAQRNSSNFDDSSVTNLMLGFDGGVDFLTGQTWGVFGQFGYRRVDYDITGGNAIRFLVGARLRVQ